MRATVAVAVAVSSLCGPTARAGELPRTIFEIERLSDGALARLPDVRVPLGRALEQRQLAEKSPVELRIMRNSIFAQVGYRFKTPWLRKYFGSRKWYPKGPYRPGKLAAVDRTNFRLIKQRELGRVKRQVAVAKKTGDLAGIARLSAAELKKLPDIIAPIGRTRITEESLAGKGRIELRILRNSIYAQYGRTFNTRWLQAYFDSRRWYKQGGFKTSKLTAVDLENIDLLKRHEYALRKPDQALVLKTGYCEYEDDEMLLFRLVFKTRGRLFHSRENLGAYGPHLDRRQCKGTWRVDADGNVTYRSCFTRNKWRHIQPDPKTHQCHAD